MRTNQQPAKVQQLFILGSDVIEGISRSEIVATYQDMLELDIAKPPVDIFDVEMSGLSYVKLCDQGIEILNGKLRTAIDERTRIEGMLPEDELTYKQEVEAEFARLNSKADEAAMARAASLGYAKGRILGAREAVEEAERTGELDPERAENLRRMTARISYRRNPDDGCITCGASIRLGDSKGFTSKLENRSLLKDVECDPIGYAYCVLLVLLATRNVIRETTVSKAARLGIGKNRYPYTTTLKLGAITETAKDGAGVGAARRPHLRRGHIRRQHYGPGNEFVKRIWVQPVFVNATEGWIAPRTAYNVSKESAT